MSGLLSEPWAIWSLLALVLGLVELTAPGYYLIWIALGAGLTAVVAMATGLPFIGQLVVFAMGAAVACVVGHFAYRRLHDAHPDDATVNQRGQDMVGSRGTVAVPLSGGQGKVRIGDSVWLAEGPDLPEGAEIVVRAMNGTVAIVDRV